ncbi:MAG: DUF87 domain-containing protein [Chloroflexota bacterium]
MINTDGKFFLGNVLDTETPILYDPDDLTTHAVVLGMTGSGKTGLCIGLLEEAALNNIPSLMIDPKGDITNALLHFPDLLPSDFQPWINPDQARRDEITTEEAAEKTAALWKKGLKKWGIGKERITALKNSAHFAVFTPGSDAGIPVSILATLKAPELDWEGNQELLREKISGTVTALLGLVGFSDIDPVRSREHILLANIFERAWSVGRDLDLGELILQTQNPPFEKLGVMDLKTFFPKKDRFELAMSLNNILASPAFQSWIEGMPLDIESMLWGPDGKPRHSVFYLAHLADTERMFFTTLLYSAIESWMRAQPGSTSLRALVYFDEIYGYMPPSAKPPSKPLMLRMLKQARAFGIGQVLVTQNPVDVDYKGLSNTGTWFIGKLQTDNDKQRLLDGLEGAASGNMNRKQYDKLISGLGKREFLLHNVHEKKPAVFGTRWVMNYLAGPLTRTHIPALNKLAGASILESAPKAKPEKSSTAAAAAQPKASKSAGTETRPAVPTGVAEYFLPNNLTLAEAFKTANQLAPADAESQGLIYKPVLLAQADVRYLQRKYNLDHEEKVTAMVQEPDRRGMARWEEHLVEAVNPRELDGLPASGARFDVLDAPLSDGKLVKSMEADLVDWIYRRSSVTVFSNAALKLYAGQPTTEGEFRKMLSEASRDGRDADLKKLQATYKKKLASMDTKLKREQRELAEDKTEVAQRTMEELGTHFENIFMSKSTSRRRVSSSLSKRRMTAQAKADVEESIDAIAQLEQEMAAIRSDMELAIDEVEDKWEETASQFDEINVTPYKKDILVEIFGVAWLPYHQVEASGKLIEIPGYSG